MTQLKRPYGKRLSLDLVALKKDQLLKKLWKIFRDLIGGELESMMKKLLAN